MPEQNDDWIARRAYALWEEQGRPHGRDADHWNAAFAEYESLREAARLTTENADRRIAKAQASQAQKGKASFDTNASTPSKGGTAS